MRPRGALTLARPLGLVGVLALVACAAAPRPAGLERLEGELARTRTELEATRDQVAELMRRVALLAERVETSQLAAPAAPPRRLKVIKLQPGTTARQAPPPAALTPEAPPPGQTPERLYERALEIYRAGRHDDAEVAFMKFLSYYPSHEYSDNAYYWMGESRLDRKQHAAAAESFLAVVEKYPDGNKVPDALFRLAQCYEALERREEALMTLKELVANYPRTSAGGRARQRLMELDPSEG